MDSTQTCRDVYTVGVVGDITICSEPDLTKEDTRVRVGRESVPMTLKTTGNLSP